MSSNSTPISWMRNLKYRDKKGYLEIKKLNYYIRRILKDKAVPHPPSKGFLRKGFLCLAIRFLVVLRITCRLITWWESLLLKVLYRVAG